MLFLPLNNAIRIKKQAFCKWFNLLAHPVVLNSLYRVGQIKRGQLTFLLLTSEHIYNIK